MTIAIWALSIFSVITLIGLLCCVFVIKGFLKTRDTDLKSYKRNTLTGVKIEEIRRRLIHGGMNDIIGKDVLDLIYTIRTIQLGVFEDKNPYVPPGDPYDGIQEDEKEVWV
jgi:hypothetical protein